MVGSPTNPAKGPTVFNCPNCGAGVEVRAQGVSISVVCKACGSIIDANDENHEILSAFQINAGIQPLIPLGQRGKLRHIHWEVIGFMLRADAGQYQWREYLLFNPTRGFRWLTEFNGHWNYVLTIKKNSQVIAGQDGSGRRYVDYMNHKYYLFNRGSARVRYVLGEFYWRVKVGDSAVVEDYIHPPEMLSSEKTAEEAIWSVGEYIEPEEISKAFGIKQNMPARQGLGANQPSPYPEKLAGIGGIWWKFALVLAGIQLLSLILAKKENVFSQEYTVRAGATEVSPSFDLKYGRSNVEVELYSPIANNWLEITAELVNDHTGAVYGFEHGVEYYHGSDSDGPWTNGGQSGKIMLSYIPAGTYHLNIKPSAGDASPLNLSYKISVVRGAVIWANFNAALVLLSLPLILFSIRKGSFEVNRWSASDYSPYGAHE